MNVLRISWRARSTALGYRHKREVEKTDKEQRQRIVYVTFSAAYVLCILYITIMSRTPALVQTVRPVPFWSFFEWFNGNWSRGRSIALNVLLFVPLGYLLSGVWESKWARVLTCLGITIIIEVTQYSTYRGYFDIDDIIANFLGGVIGVMVYHWFSGRLIKFHIPVLLSFAGIVGCVITTGNIQVYETQFDFQIQSVDLQDDTVIALIGTCDIYRRDFLPYQIQLKGENGVYWAKTEAEGTRFIATTDVPIGEYEVDVVFNGYQPINTKNYINGDQVQYVSDAPSPDIAGTDFEFLLDTGVLKVYNSDYDAYVYQVDNHLFWLIGADFDASIIYHLYTEETENLPENRIQYGFDNRSLWIGSEKDLTSTMNCGKYRIFSDIIPTEYKITAVAVGMNKGPDVFWREFFRLK